MSFPSLLLLQLRFHPHERRLFHDLPVSVLDLLLGRFVFRNQSFVPPTKGYKCVYLLLKLFRVLHFDLFGFHLGFRVLFGD